MYRPVVPVKHTEALEQTAIPTASKNNLPSSYLHFSTYSVTSACQTIIGTITSKSLTTTETAVTLRSPFTVAVNASMGNQDLNIFAAGNAQRLLNTHGRFEGCLANAKQIPPYSSIVATTA